ncbi:MAG: DUF711 family protein [Candidatus Thermoplasmatota archaeon]|nr:DUF711 family protein [Candidatus Thermoplasmatota archaeon]
MRIRTVTLMMDIDPNIMDEQIEEASAFLQGARETFREGGWEVQTVRASTQPFGNYLGPDNLDTAIELDRLAVRSGIDHIGIGPAIDPLQIGMVPRILERTLRTSASCIICSDSIIEENIISAARAVKAISGIEKDGMKNFHFCCMATCPPGIPFFPASYSSGEGPSFSIGLESADLLHTGNERAPFEERFKAYTDACLSIEMVASGLGGFEYAGIDTSLNPSISPEGSAALVIEGLSGSPFGSPGTLAACSELTDRLRSIPIKRTGFCGLMFPIMEDAHLASLADDGLLDLQRLLLYSSVCGTGLDAVPLRGDISESVLSSILRDVAHLSWRLGKPLTARLLPCPGKRTELSSEHLINCRVIDP